MTSKEGSERLTNAERKLQERFPGTKVEPDESGQGATLSFSVEELFSKAPDPQGDTYVPIPHWHAMMDAFHALHRAVRHQEVCTEGCRKVVLPKAQTQAALGLLAVIEHARKAGVTPNDEYPRGSRDPADSMGYVVLERQEVERLAGRMEHISDLCMGIARAASDANADAAASLGSAVIGYLHQWMWDKYLEAMDRYDTDGSAFALFHISGQLQESEEEFERSGAKKAQEDREAARDRQRAEAEEMIAKLFSKSQEEPKEIV